MYFGMCSLLWGEDLYHLQPGEDDGVVAAFVNLVFMIIVFIRLKLIYEGKA